MIYFSVVFFFRLKEQIILPKFVRSLWRVYLNYSETRIFFSNYHHFSQKQDPSVMTVLKQETNMEVMAAYSNMYDFPAINVI